LGGTRFYAETSRELKEYAKAEPSLKKLVTLDPKNIEYKLMLGRNYIDLEQGKEAEEVLQEALNLKSDDNLLHHYAGVAYRLMKNYEQALVEINKSILSNAEFKPNYYELALNYDAMSDYANAVKSLDMLFKLDPNHIRGTLLGAELYGKIGDYDKAVVFYKKILKSQPEDWRSRINLANNYLKLTQPNEAGKEFIQALKQNPKSSEGWIGLGKIYEDRNDHLKAVSYYIKARDLDPSNPEVYYRLGYVFKDVGNRAQARSAFKKFLELDPKTKFKSVVEDELTDLEGN
jgi:tetratricopeptide (TPR) repeat protein